MVFDDCMSISQPCFLLIKLINISCFRHQLPKGRRAPRDQSRGPKLVAGVPGGRGGPDASRFDS